MNERIKELAEQAGLNWRFSPAYEECLERFAELVRQDEREACAKLSDEHDDDVGMAISRAIRARSKHD